MLITKESDYGIRIIRALKTGELLTIQQICENEKIPKQFAYKILKKLEKSGLVLVRRGSGGGCLLGKPVSEITLYDIVWATDEEVFLTHCLKHGFQCDYAAHTGSCNIHKELARVQGILETELKRYTMEELIGG